MIDGSSTNYLFHVVGKNAKTYNGHFTDKQVTKLQKKIFHNKVSIQADVFNCFCLENNHVKDSHNRL